MSHQRSSDDRNASDIGSVNHVVEDKVPCPTNTSDDVTGPRYKDQVHGESVIPVEVKEVHSIYAPNINNELQHHRAINVHDAIGPSYKDQIQDVTWRQHVDQVQKPNIIEIANVGPNYKDQVRNTDLENNNGVSQLTENENTCFENDSNMNVHDNTLDDEAIEADIISAHLVPNSADTEHHSLPKAEIVDTKKERCRLITLVSMIVVGILIVILLPTYFVIIKKDEVPTSNNSNNNNVTMSTASDRNTVIPTDSTAPTQVIPSSIPTISMVPSIAPTKQIRFTLLGDPIQTDLIDLLDQSRIQVSLSHNGTIVAIGNNNTIQVYQQNTTTTNIDVTIEWIPLGSSLSVVSEYLDDNNRYYSMFLAPGALILAVGIPSYQGGAGHVETYIYDSTSDSWVRRGNSRVGNSTDQLGHEVALNFDGTGMGIAASNYNNRTSYVEVLLWNVTTNIWDPIGQINGLSGAPDLSIDMSGSRVILGDPGDGYGGNVEVYECTVANGCLLLDRRFEGLDYEDFFGYDVSVKGDRIAIGAPGIVECRELCANVVVYEYARGTESLWSQVGQELLGPIGFGSKVKLSSFGTTLAIVYDISYFEKATHVYSLENGIWTPFGDPIPSLLLDMSDDGVIFATLENGTVVLQELLSVLSSTHGA